MGLRLLLLIIFALICTMLFVIQYIMFFRRNLAQTVAPLELNPQKSNVKLLLSASEIITCWKDVIAQANSSIVFSTYIWQLDSVGNDTTPHVWFIGKGLLSIETPVVFKIMINRVVWKGKQYLKNTIEKTLGVWKHMGVNFNLIKIEWGIWSHYTLGNIHTKILAVDDRLTVIQSLNVEGRSHGGRGTWRETGILIDDKEINEKIRQDFTYHWKQCEYWKCIPKENTLTFSPTIYTGSNQFKSAKVQVLFQRASKNIFSLNRRSDSTRAIFSLIKKAKSDIFLITPNFNDICLWEVIKLKAEQGVKVHIMWGYDFNNTQSFLQKYFLGRRSNKDMWKDIVKKSYHPNISIRFYTSQNHKIVGKFECMVHAKIISIDRKWFTVGTCNLDIYSTITSSEVLVIVRSSSLANILHKNFIDPIWTTGEQLK